MSKALADRIRAGMSLREATEDVRKAEATTAKKVANQRAMKEKKAPAKKPEPEQELEQAPEPETPQD